MPLVKPQDVKAQERRPADTRIPRRLDIQLDLLNPGHDNCHHKHFSLNCEQYECLLARAGGCCEICGELGTNNSCQRLYIDHDPMTGQWAVRGLLCFWCNLYLTGLSQHDQDAYLAKSWYVQELRRLDITLPIPEPPMGSRIAMTGFGRVWVRGEQGWRRIDPRGRHGGSRDWAHLMRYVGPLNFPVLAGGRPA